mgnify:CR=1 FL=1
MKIYPVIIALLSLLITSCASYKESQSVVDRLTFENDTPLEDIPYKSFHIIALETKEECLLRDVLEVRPYLSYLYILDRIGDLFIFDLNGKYINQVGKKGNAPDEYIKLSSFFIDKENQCIAIIDDVKNKIYNYDLTGNHISTRSVAPSIKYSTYSVRTKEGDILFNYLINFGVNQAYSIMDRANYNKNTFLKSYKPIQVKNYLYGFSSHPISENTDGNISFIMPLCDTIFGYSNKDYYPKYVVDTPSKMVERKLFKTNTTDKGKTYSSMILKYGNDGFFTGFTGIFETDKHILLKYKYKGVVSGFYLVNKENLKGYYYICNIPKNPIKLPIINIIGSNDYEFIDVFNASDLIHLYNDINKNNNRAVLSEFKKVIKDLDEESNPCLIFYRFE